MPPTRTASGAMPAMTVSGAAAATTRNTMPRAPSAFDLRWSGTAGAAPVSGVLVDIVLP